MNDLLVSFRYGFSVYPPVLTAQNDFLPRFALKNTLKSATFLTYVLLLQQLHSHHHSSPLFLLDRHVLFRIFLFLPYQMEKSATFQLNTHFNLKHKNLLLLARTKTGLCFGTTQSPKPRLGWGTSKTLV